MTHSSGQDSGGSSVTLAATASTPAVEADWQAGRLRMVGESYPENTYELFGGIISWVDDFIRDCERPLLLDLQLNYLNTSSVRAMIEIFDRLQAAHEQGRSVAVQWWYDSRNPRSAETGEEFREDYSFEFVIRVLAD